MIADYKSWKNGYFISSPCKKVNANKISEMSRAINHSHAGNLNRKFVNRLNRNELLCTIGFLCHRLRKTPIQIEDRRRCCSEPSDRWYSYSSFTRERETTNRDEMPVYVISSVREKTVTGNGVIPVDPLSLSLALSSHLKALFLCVVYVKRVLHSLYTPSVVDVKMLRTFLSVVRYSERETLHSPLHLQSIL